MEHLTKQQIVLLTLLVGFVTSIATGIVVVSLLDQNYNGVPQIIDKIVERTIEKVPADSSTADTTNSGVTNVIISFQDQTADATAKVSKSVIRIKQAGGDSSTVTGFGLVVSKDDVIVTDKSNIATLTNPVGVFTLTDGSTQEFPLQSIQSQINGNLVFLVPIIPTDKKASVSITPISFNDSLKLGQTVLSLSGKETNSLQEGIISNIVASSTISTTITSSDVLIGSPLFTITGDVIGFKTTSETFYPMSVIKPIIPVITQ